MTGGARAKARCEALGVAPFSDSADGLFRAYLSPAHAASVRTLSEWMTAAGMVVRVDSAANLIGRYEGSTLDAQVLLIGSHIDSVRDAGCFDGPLGVMLGIELVERLTVLQRRLPFDIEVYAFGDEEGSRFPASMLCSRAVAGILEKEALAVSDRDGITVAEARASFLGAGPSDDSFVDAIRQPDKILAFVEPHIEQGPVLDAETLAVGVVTGIAAQLRLQATVKGMAAHAGTTSMALRHDALAAAAEMMGAVESLALAAGGDVVATVGRLSVSPGAVNVVPGEVTFSIDLRSGDQSVRDRVAAEIGTALAHIAERRSITLALEQVQDLPAAPCDPALIALMDKALLRCGQPPKRLVSGAGHDTMVMARLCPTAMLFLRSPGGISHNPAEDVDVADVEIALDVLAAFVDLLEEQELARIAA